MADIANITTTTNTVTITTPAGNTTTVSAVANETINVATDSLSAFNTDALVEGSTNLYHTTSRASAAAPVQTIAMPNGFGVANSSGNVAITVSNTATALNSLGANNASNITTGTLAVARLPAIQDSYIRHIETVANKTYHIDPRIPAARTITSIFTDCESGTCTATFKNGSSTIAAISVSSTEATTTSFLNGSLSENGALTVVVSSNSSCLDFRFAVEYTQ